MIGIAIGNTIGKRVSHYWTPRSWISQSECYELWQITGAGNLVGLKRGDTLVVGGSAGSYTFQCPNTAPYIAADTDYAWFQTDAVQRTVTEANLIAYDFSRTIVKYGDASPNSIEWIMILASDPASVKQDKMHQSFHLSVYWSGVWNDHGYIKDNRTGSRSVYNPYSTEANALFTRMTAVSETPTTARKLIIDVCINKLKANSLWTKLDGLWLTAAHGTLSARLNWIQDLYNLTATALPTFEADRGFTGNGSTMFLKTGFVPSTAGGNYVRDNGAFGVYTRVNVNESKAVMGGRDAGSTYATYIFTRDGNKAYGISQGTGTNITPANLDSRGLYILSRNASNAQNLYVGLTKTSNATVSVAVETTEFYILGYNAGGALGFACTNQVSFAFISSKLTDADVALINTIIVDGYLNSVGAKI